jgi:hypothetical protein
MAPPVWSVTEPPMDAEADWPRARPGIPQYKTAATKPTIILVFMEQPPIEKRLTHWPVSHSRLVDSKCGEGVS